MKKITLLIAFFLTIVTGSYGQVPSYAFSQSNGTYTPITGGTVVATATGASGAASLDDLNYSAIPIPFTFTFNGIGYTSLTINTNGHVVFGTAGSTSNYTPISSSGTYAGAISAAGRDMNALFNILGNTGQIRYETIGVAPNQTFVIQYSNFRPYDTSTSTTTFWRWNFQIRLNETTNKIDIVYDYNFVGAPTSSTHQVGLRGANNTFATNVNNRLITSGTHTWATSVSGTTNASTCAYNTTLLPVSGLTYSWTPPVPCSGTPTAGSVLPSVQAVCTGSTPANLVGSGYSSGVAGLTFQWEESNDDGVGDAWANAVGGTGATTATYTPPAFSGTAIYYRLNVTCSNSVLSAQTASVSITPPTNPSNQVTNATQGTATLTTIPLSWTSGNGGRRVVYFNSVNSFTDPVNGNGPALTAATAYAGGQQIVYDGTGTGVTVTGLTGGTTYYVKVYEYLRCGAGPYDYYYNVTTGTNLATVATASPPVNDNFANASPATCGNTYTGSTALASLDEDSAPDFGAVDMDAPNVWYTYTGSGVAETITVDLCASSYDSSVLIYTGTSGALTVIAGNDDAGGSCGTRSLLNFTSDGTTTYYIAIEGYNVTSTGAYSMLISCVPACTPAVANQVCATALAVNTDGVDVNSDNSCGDVSPVQPSCDLFGTIQDVWFSFVGPANGIVDCLVTPIGMTSANFAIYEGVDCSTLTLIAGTCNSDFTTPTSEALTGLVDGATYYIQVWSNAVDQGTFTLNLDSPACVAPTNLAIANLGESSADITWDLVTGNYQYVLDEVAIDPAGAGTDLSGEVYYATGLASETQYYFHLRTDCGGSVYSDWVTISFTTPAPPPANDDCIGATILTPAGSFAAGAIVSSIVGATNSEDGDATIPDPGCAAYVGGDVWFSAVVPASGSLTFETGQEAGGLDDTGLAVYSGDCNPSGLTLLDCDDESGVDSFSLISVTGRTEGEVLLVRAWNWNSATPKNVNAVGEFQISAWDTSLGRNSFDLNGFSAYPNPVKDVLNLSYTKEISNVAVYNLLGQEVLAVNVNALQSKINMTALSNGTYLVKVTVDGLTKTLKVIKE